MILANIIAAALWSAGGGAGRPPLFICAAGQLFREVASALAEFQYTGTRLLRFVHAVLSVDSSSNPKPSTPSSSASDPLPRYCRTCQQFEDRPGPYHSGLVTANDVAKVVDQLGLAWDDNEAEEIPDDKTDEDYAIFMCRDCKVRGVALTLLEQKEAGEQELREAFAVFDANRDGYITPTELWMVMRRLDLGEGMMLEECRRMVEAFDHDGDGRISFAEFRSLLEMAS